MERIQVRILKDKVINLKINSGIFDHIKKMAIQNDHFVGDYINHILLEHLKNEGMTVEMHINDYHVQTLKKQENEE